MSSMTIGSGLYQSYSHIASGKRINTAADDAAGLAIGQKLQRQENGLSVAANNAQDAWTNHHLVERSASSPEERPVCMPSFPWT